MRLIDTYQEYTQRYDKDGAPWFEALSFDCFASSPFYIWLMEYKGTYKKPDNIRHPLETISRIAIEHNQDLTKQCQNLQSKYRVPLKQQKQQYIFTCLFKFKDGSLPGIVLTLDSVSHTWIDSIVHKAP